LQEERFIGPARGARSRISRFIARPAWAQAFARRSLGRSLLANAVRVRLGWGWRPGGGGRQPQRTRFKSYLTRARPLSLTTKVFW